MATTADFRNGWTFVHKGELYKILEFQHVKPGKGGAFVRTKLRNARTGKLLDKTFRAGEKVDVARIEAKEMEYLYRGGEHYYFMDTQTYEQLLLNSEAVADAVEFLAPNIRLKMEFFEDEPIGLELPTFVDIRVEQTEPGIKGDTATGGTKPAKTETGSMVQVPLFIDMGDLIKVDTRTGRYVERVT